MKKFIFTLMTLFVLAVPASQADIKDLLGSLAGAAGGSSSSDSSDSSGSSALGDALGGLISGLLGGGQLSEADIAGIYQYKEPAVTFKSDNLLQKAGGAAMAATIVNKLAPYYSRAGMENLVVTLNADKTFEFQLGKIKLSGTFERDSAQTQSNSFVFNFTAFGKLKLSSIDADVQRTSSGIIITFDASKLLTLVNTIANLTGKQSLQAAASFLNSYDGLNCGFSLTKTGNVAPAATSGTSTESTDSSTTKSGLGSLLDLLGR